MQDGVTFQFNDRPINGCLFGGDGCGGATAPFGEAMIFETRLVGMLAGNVATDPFFTFTWKSTFNGGTGGVSQLAGGGGGDGPDGVGQNGITILSIKGRAIAPAAIPEPSTWAVLMLGFGAIGARLRTRRSLQA